MTPNAVRNAQCNILLIIVRLESFKKLIELRLQRILSQNFHNRVNFILQIRTK